MLSVVYMVIAGNFINENILELSDDANELELYDSFEAAEIFGKSFDYYSITSKELHCNKFEPPLQCHEICITN